MVVAGETGGRVRLALACSAATTYARIGARCAGRRVTTLSIQVG